MICSTRRDGSTACMTIEGATDTEVFRVYVRQVLCPTLRPGDVVIMDNLSPHKSVETLSLIQQLGAEVLFLPLTPRTSIRSKRCGANPKNFYAAPKPVPGRALSRRLPRLWRPSQPKTSSIGWPHAALGLFNLLWPTRPTMSTHREERMKMRLAIPLVGLAISFALPTYARQKDVADPQTTQKILAVVKT